MKLEDLNPFKKKAGAFVKEPVRTLDITTTEAETKILIMFPEKFKDLKVEDVVLSNGSIKEDSLITLDGGLIYNAIIVATPESDVMVYVSKPEEYHLELIIEFPVVLVITPIDEEVIKVRVTLSKPLVPVLSLDELLVTNADVKKKSFIVDGSGLIYEFEIIPSGTEVIEVSLLATIEDEFKAETVAIIDEEEEIEEPTYHKRLERVQKFRK